MQTSTFFAARTQAPQPGTGPHVGLGTGLGLATGAAGLTMLVSQVLPSLSALLVAIVLGVVVGNTGLLPARALPGLAVVSRRALRLGIVLLGLHVSLAEIGGLGLGIVAVAAAVVGGGFAVAEFGGRRLGLPRAERLLIGAGMSICGAAAVAAVEGVVEDRDKREHVVTAVALVVLFGTLMMAVVPMVATALRMDARLAGLWAGASIHEVAQVVATGEILGATALQAAVVVKLTRVLMLAPVVALLGMRRRRIVRLGQADTVLPPLVPLFIVGFLGAVLVRTAGVLPTAVLEPLAAAQTFLLAAAMFALGCGVRMATLRSVGGRPFVLAAVTTLTVAAIGAVGVLLAG